MIQIVKYMLFDRSFIMCFFDEFLRCEDRYMSVIYVNFGFDLIVESVEFVHLEESNCLYSIDLDLCLMQSVKIEQCLLTECCNLPVVSWIIGQIHWFMDGKWCFSRCDSRSDPLLFELRSLVVWKQIYDRSLFGIQTRRIELIQCSCWCGHIAFNYRTDFVSAVNVGRVSNESLLV